jgi:hypothetical protein
MLCSRGLVVAWVLMDARTTKWTYLIIIYIFQGLWHRCKITEQGRSPAKLNVERQQRSRLCDCFDADFARGKGVERVKCGSQKRHHAATKPDEAASHEVTVNTSTSSAVQRAQLHLQANDRTCSSPSALKILNIEIFPVRREAHL